MSKRRRGPQPTPAVHESTALRQLEATNALLIERVSALELEAEQAQAGWMRSGQVGQREPTAEERRQINYTARWMYLRNPLIGRGVSVQAHYVFGQGVNIHARAAAVDQVVQAFLDDPHNQAELTSHQARMTKDVELALFANLYFVVFTNRATGRVRVRSIPADEITDIITNPEDAKEPWFYRREWAQETVDLASGNRTTQQMVRYYPDLRYRPPAPRPERIGDAPIEWDAPIYHVKTNCLSDMRMGVSEVWAAIDWARAYKEFLEDWATLSRAYSRWAHKVTMPTKAAVGQAKTKLGTTLGTAGYDTNPPPVTGSTAILGPGASLDPIRIGGANVSAEDGRRLLLMVAAATGLPETFFGDVSVGTLATSKSLDRPTELKMRARQTLWGDIFRTLLTYVVVCAIEAVAGPLHGLGLVNRDGDGNPTITLYPVTDEETGQEEEQDPALDIDWPPLLEHDVEAKIRAIKTAVTLDGAQPTVIPDLRTVARLVLTGLGEDDVDELLDQLFPQDQADGAQDGNAAAGGVEEEPAPEAMMTEAVRELREALKAFVGKYVDATA